MTVDVTAVNDAPTVVNDTDSVTEGGTVIETTNGEDTVISDDSDVDGDSLTVSGTVTQTSATDTVEVLLQSVALTVHLLDLQLQVIMAN